MLLYTWDVQKAKQLVAGREATQHVGPEQLKKYGLQVEKSEPDESGWTTISMFGHSEEHLSHIPVEKLSEPIIFAPLIQKETKEIIKSYVLIDGTHRAIIHARKGEDTPCIVLSEQESLDCMTLTAREQKQFNLFPGLKKGL